MLKARGNNGRTSIEALTIDCYTAQETTPATRILGDAADLSALAGHYIDSLLLSNLSASTIRQYGFTLGVFLRWLDTRGVRRPRDLRTEHVRAYLVERKESVRQWTLLQNRSVIAAFCRWLRDQHLAPVDPDRIPRVATPNADEVERRHVLDGELVRLFNGLRADYRKARREGKPGCWEAANLLCFALLFGAGLRIGEVAAIRVRDLDCLKRELFVPRTKSNVPRTVVLPGSVTAYARLYLRLRSGCSVKSAYLFTSIRGGALAVHTMAQRVKRLAAQQGLKITSHAGRRFCATRLAAENLLAAKQQLGHRNIETTIIYVRAGNELLHRVMRRADPLR